MDYTCKSTNAVQTTLLCKGFLMSSILFPLVNGYRIVKEIDSISSFSRSQVQKKTSVPSKTVAEPLPERRQSRWWRPLVSVPELSCLNQTHSRQTRKPREWEVIHGTFQGNRNSKNQDTTSTDKSHARGVSFFALHLLSTLLDELLGLRKKIPIDFHTTRTRSSSHHLTNSYHLLQFLIPAKRLAQLIFILQSMHVGVGGSVSNKPLYLTWAQTSRGLL